MTEKGAGLEADKRWVWQYGIRRKNYFGRQSRIRTD